MRSPELTWLVDRGAIAVMVTSGRRIGDTCILPLLGGDPLGLIMVAAAMVLDQGRFACKGANWNAGRRR